MHIQSKSVGVLCILGSCTSLQFGSAFAMQLFPVIGAGTTSFLRLGLAGTLMLLIIRPTFRYSWQQWRAIILFALSFAGMNGFFYLAIARIPLGVAVTLEFTGPLLLSAFLSRRLRDLLWVILAAAGLLVLACDSENLGMDLLGALFAVIAGAFWAWYILASKQVGALVPGQSGLALAIFFGAWMLMPFGVQNLSMVDGRILLFALFMAVLSSVVPYSLELSALRIIPPATVSILLSLEPVIASLAGLLILGQPITLGIMCAMFCIIVASIGSTRTV